MSRRVGLSIARKKQRFTENAAPEEIADSRKIWHSTAIEEADSSRVFGENLHGSTPIPRATPAASAAATKSSGNGSSKEDGNKKNSKGMVPGKVAAAAVGAKEQSADSGRGPSTSRDKENIEDLPPPPIVISAPSGHAFFSTILQKCGYIIKQPTTNNDMFYDVMNFRKKLGDWLKSHDDEMSRIETDASKFIKALNAYVSDKENFKTSMRPTKHATELIQPSLLHCLLGIDALQPIVLEIVMPLLGEAAFSASDEDTLLVATILNQLKWLPTIVDGEKFSKSLLTVVDSAVYTCQCQIIRLLPDILPSNLHASVAEKLLEKFSEDGVDLNIALMDCFSSLDIPDGYWLNIRTAAIDQMTSASLKDIPAYFAFLFRAETIHSLSEVITTMREKVDLIPENRNPKNDAYQVEILEKVSFCIIVNPTIVKIWLKQIKDDINNQVTEMMKTIDLIMLLVFAESHKSSIIILKLLLADKKLALRLFAQMMKNNTPMVYQLFKTIAKILDSFLRSRDAKCQEAVCEITVELFLGLGPLAAQELMGNMSGILVNFPPARDAVLQILTKLADKEPKKLLHFAPYLMSVLEYVMQFPARQIRSLMNILAILSQTEGRNPGETNNFSTEFSILLRKQLTHSDLKIRCFGVFGALASVRQMASREDPDDVRIKELLKLAWNFVERDEDACGIFFDEMASCAPQLPAYICKLFRNTLQCKFQKLWAADSALVSGSNQYGQRAGLHLVEQFDANRECTQDSLTIVLENQPLEMSPLVIPAHIRVLAALTRNIEEDLSVVDALLGCPVLFPRTEEYYDQNSIADFSYNQRCHLGQYLVLAINFFRESVSAFVLEEDAELRVKVWVRLDNILKLQKYLVQHIDNFPSLPIAYVAEKTLGTARDGAGPSGLAAFRANHSKAPEEKKKKGKGPSNSKKKPRREIPLSDTDSESDSGGTGTAVAKVTSVKKGSVNIDEDIQPKRILPYLRRFDSDVFKLLRFPLVCNEIRDVNISSVLNDLSRQAQNADTLGKVEKFTPETLTLLLTELKQQATDTSTSSKFNILSIRRLIKYICVHINTISEFRAENENDDRQEDVECCLRLLLNILFAIFEAFKKLDKDTREEHVDKSMKAISSQVQASGAEKSQAQTEIIGNVANYFGGLAVIIKEPATALDHMKVLQIIHDLLEGHKAIKKAIDEVAKQYLKNKWKLPSSQVDGFLKIWIATAKSPIDVIKHLARKLLRFDDVEGEQMDMSEDDSPLNKLPNNSIYKSCTETNFHTWYSAMLAGLSQHVHKNLRRRGDFDDSIEQWVEAIDVFKELVEMTKNYSKNFILVALLKHCRLFLEAFISGGAELLPAYWKHDTTAAQKFCTSLQKPCRTIQHICEHSKKTTDLQLLKSVPLVKRVLETLVFRVREVLGVNGAASAFWMGSLKHRDLTGAAMDSQIVPDTSNVSLMLSSSEDDDDIGDAMLSGIGGGNEESMDVDRVFEDSDADS